MVECANSFREMDREIVVVFFPELKTLLQRQKLYFLEDGHFFNKVSVFSLPTSFSICAPSSALHNLLTFATEGQASSRNVFSLSSPVSFNTSYLPTATTSGVAALAHSGLRFRAFSDSITERMDRMKTNIKCSQLQKIKLKRLK